MADLEEIECFPLYRIALLAGGNELAPRAGGLVSGRHAAYRIQRHLAEKLQSYHPSRNHGGDTMSVYSLSLVTRGVD